MRKKFVITSNVKAFMAGVEAVETRGAPEAGWIVAEGAPGLGKTGCLTWWYAQSDSIYVRAKKKWTVNWALRDLMSALGEAPVRSTEAMLERVQRCITLSRQTIMVDEIQHALSGGIIEVLRDISDHTETPIIIGGHRGIAAHLRRFEQIDSRVAHHVDFQPLNADDVRKICTELAEIDIDDKTAEQLHRETGGSMRRLKNRIARLEIAGPRRVA